MKKASVKDDLKKQLSQGKTPVESALKQHEMALNERRKAATSKVSGIGTNKTQFKGGKPVGKGKKTAAPVAKGRDFLGNLV